MDLGGQRAGPLEGGAVVVGEGAPQLREERFGLVEKLAERIAAVLMQEFKSPQVKVSLTKCGVLREAKRVGVQIERSR